MNWFTRLKATPSYFKVFLIVLCVDGLLSFSFLIPTLYQHGFSHLGNLWWMALIWFFFLFPANRQGLRAIRFFGVCIAAIYSISTISIYLLDRGAHASYPSNPSFYFLWFHWLDGVVFPWLVALTCLALPQSALPLKPSPSLANKTE
jgi:hypothetical protein